MMRRSFRALSRRTAIEKAIEDINKNTLRPQDRFGFVAKSTYNQPMVMLLGNHSAGKSTFINALLGREEQETGVAPTDDGFTVLVRGDVNMTEDGPAAVTNPNLKFEEVQKFGFNFVNHFRVKTRKLQAGKTALPDGMMIVDTPGMIDTPIHMASRTSIEGQNRGYDFLAVTKWFAQRSDVILLLFDPSNPGTTGETLDVLTQSLAGMEHKFLILLNKVDMFDKVTDFGRAYGTLCWNLSKVISMKDVPRIFTTYTPIDADGSAKSGSSAVPLHELTRNRREVMDEVLRAPLRRLDNLITEMDESAKRMLLAAKVINTLRRRHQTRLAACMFGGVAACVGIPVVSWALIFPVELTSILAMMMISAAGIGGSLYGLNNHMQEFERKLVKTIDSVLEEHYPSRNRSHDVTQRWENTIRQLVLDEIENVGIRQLKGTPRSAVGDLEHVIQYQVPDLRAKVNDYKQEILRGGDESLKAE